MWRFIIPRLAADDSPMFLSPSTSPRPAGLGPYELPRAHKGSAVGARETFNWKGSGTPTIGAGWTRPMISSSPLYDNDNKVFYRYDDPRLDYNESPLLECNCNEM